MATKKELLNELQTLGVEDISRKVTKALLEESVEKSRAPAKIPEAVFYIDRPLRDHRDALNESGEKATIKSLGNEAVRQFLAAHNISA